MKHKLIKPSSKNKIDTHMNKNKTLHYIDERARKTNQDERKMAENLHGITHGNLSDALQKRLGSDFPHGNDFFH